MAAVFRSVVLISGIAEVNIPGSCVSFIAELGRAFARLGLHTSTVVITDYAADIPRVIEEFLALSRRGLRPFVFDLNAKIAHLLSAKGVPCFSLVLDHPLGHPQLGSMGEASVIGLIDAGHAAIQGYTRAGRVFIPHGGPPPAERLLPMAERDIALLFCGHVWMHEEYLRVELRNYSPPARAVVLAAIERYRDGGRPVQEALIAAFAEHGIGLGDFGRDGLAKIVNFVTNYCESLARLALLRALAGRPVHVIGDIPQLVRRDLDPGFTYEGSQPFARLMDLLPRTRFLVNSSPKFSAGSHERIWYALSQGCAVVSSWSSFLHEALGDAIVSYRDPAEVPDLLARADAGTLADRALPLYRAGHTWEARAGAILDAMNQQS
jgi:hypothetical protein